MDNLQLKANLRPRVRFNRCVHIKRSLSGKGKILVKKNEEIKPEDVIGTSEPSLGYTWISLTKKLGIKPRDCSKYLQRPLGGKIFKGELLALKKGLFGKKVITAPTDGIIESCDAQTGDLLIKFLSKETSLVSGVFGIVDDVDHSNGQVLIRTLVSEVLGICGSGRERDGILTIINNRYNLLHHTQVTPDFRQHIVVAGSLVYGDALRKAAGYGVAGIICGGLNLNDYLSMVGVLDPYKKVGTDVGVSVVATEGFGLVPIGDDIYGVINKHNGKFCYINGNLNKLVLPSTESDSILTLRRVIIPVAKAPDPLPEVVLGDIKVGAKARIIWPPYFGAQGIIVGIDKKPSLTKTGITTVFLTLNIGNKDIRVPFPNIELLA